MTTIKASQLIRNDVQMWEDTLDTNTIQWLVSYTLQGDTVLVSTNTNDFILVRRNGSIVVVDLVNGISTLDDLQIALNKADKIFVDFR